MKKRIQMLCILLVMIIIGGLLIINKNKQIRMIIDESGQITLNLSADSDEQKLNLWYNEKDRKYYFFLPSFCSSDKVYLEELGEHIVRIEQREYREKDSIQFKENLIYEMEIENKDDRIQKYDIIFMKSANLPAIFIDTQSGNMNYLHENKMNEEVGKISVIREKGNVEYKGVLEKITGRGNSTWVELSKKSYTFSLHDSFALCGMGAGKKWNLLAIYEEGTRMGTKIAMDMAASMEMQYAVSNTWIDLYLNGEYAGNYLLSEPVMVGENRVEIYDLEKENRQNNPNIDFIPTFNEANRKGYLLPVVNTIDGGFLIEKDYSVFYGQEYAGFVLDSENHFTIKSPKHASYEQVEYIRNFVQNIDNLIINGNAECLKFIDLESFTKRFLIDEISLEADTNIASMFFYKNKDEDVLYAGPVWDYDNAMGECNAGWMEGRGVNYECSTNQSFKPEMLNWNRELLEYSEFQEELKKNYLDLLPFMKYLLDEGIDLYAAKIQKSVEMDDIRWGNVVSDTNYPGNYQTFQNDIRYLKFFLVNRLNYLMEQWQIPFERLVFKGNGKTHTVTFKIDGNIVETRTFLDGERILEAPPLDEEKYWGWYYTYSKEKLRPHLPVLEDCAFTPKEK